MINTLGSKIRAVLFDFDGVIVDSSKDIASSVNETLVNFGFKKLPEATIISFVGNGAYDWQHTITPVQLHSRGVPPPSLPRSSSRSTPPQ